MNVDSKEYKKWIMNYVKLKGHKVEDVENFIIIDEIPLEFEVIYPDPKDAHIPIQILIGNHTYSHYPQTKFCKSIDLDHTYDCIKYSLKDKKVYTNLKPNINVCLNCKYFKHRIEDAKDHDFSNNEDTCFDLYCEVVEEDKDYQKDQELMYFSYSDLKTISKYEYFRVPKLCPSKLEHTVLVEKKIKNIRKTLMNFIISDKMKVGFKTFEKMFKKLDNANSNQFTYKILFNMFHYYEQITKELEFLNKSEGKEEE